MCVGPCPGWSFAPKWSSASGWPQKGSPKRVGPKNRGPKGKRLLVLGSSMIYIVELCSPPWYYIATSAQLSLRPTNKDITQLIAALICFVPYYLFSSLYASHCVLLCRCAPLSSLRSSLRAKALRFATLIARRCAPIATFALLTTSCCALITMFARSLYRSIAALYRSMFARSIVANAPVTPHINVLRLFALLIVARRTVCSYCYVRSAHYIVLRTYYYVRSLTISLYRCALSLYVRSLYCR
jgi:hypothetical protein